MPSDCRLDGRLKSVRRKELEDDCEAVGSDCGSALSFALRLKKRKSGTSQTQVPKKVAISRKPGTFGTVPLYAL
jgi:hypothetical protein